ncbi:MAG: serine hydrolase, partial [Flavobacteriaceae bacterium]
MKNLAVFIFSIFLFGQSNYAQQNVGKETLLKMGFDAVSVSHQVDSIITQGIKSNAFPGAQILVAKDNQIIFHKAYGYHTYDSVQTVSLNDIYDLASVTKITGPLPAIMKLVDEKKLDLDTPFSTYWKPWRKRRDKKDLTLRQILSHQAGLVPYIVFMGKVMKDGKLKKRFIKEYPSKRFQKQIYDGLYIKNRFQRKMHRIITRSKVSYEKVYNYSGLSFLIFPALISQLTQTDYEAYLHENFYTPLMCSTLGFNPSSKKMPNAVVPTEIDTLFRKGLVKGWVHDENASLLGGISGNAGLFGTAQDLAIIMQMYVQGGLFNGKQYLSKNTVQEFTSVQYPANDNRRGLGFDKPYLKNDQFTLANAYPAP